MRKNGPRFVASCFCSAMIFWLLATPVVMRAEGNSTTTRWLVTTSPVKVKVTRYPGPFADSGVLYVVPHDDENVAPVAVAAFLEKSPRGGTLLEFVYSDMIPERYAADSGARVPKWKPGRYIVFQVDPGGTDFFLDPNRMFTVGLKGHEKDCYVGTEENYCGNKEAEAYVSKLSQVFLRAFFEDHTMCPGGRPSAVIAVHNNTGFRVTSGPPDLVPKEAPVIKEKDHLGDFVLVTDLTMYARLKAEPYNVVLQDSDRIRSSKGLNDGSLSVYCGLMGINYFNVEALFRPNRGIEDPDNQRTKAKQVKMLGSVEEVLSTDVHH